MLKIGKLRGSPGDETFAIRGTLGLQAGLAGALDPTTRGLQIRLEDVGTSEPLIDLTAASTPVPPGGRGSGCDAHDGWKKLAYRNKSGAVPPLCAAGSAHGLRSVRLKDERLGGGGIAFVINGRGASLAKPTGPLRLTIVLGADRAAGLDGACGTHVFEQTSCKSKRAVFRCK